MKKKLILRVGDEAIVTVSHIMQKPYGLVVVGVVTEGEIHQGDPVNIPAEGKEPLPDGITRIEFFGDEIKKAALGLEVGICLKTTSKEILLEHLGN
jgi:translation elongation factor EF-Tu-like GTPase